MSNALSTELAAMRLTCPRCEAGPGRPCIKQPKTGRRTWIRESWTDLLCKHPHPERIAEARECP